MDAPPDVTAAHARRRSLYRVGNATLLALWVAALALSRTSAGARLGLTPDALRTALVGAALLSVAARHFLWRCPNCDASLGRDIDPSACPQCGAHLRGPTARPADLAPAEAEAVFEAYAARTRRQRVIIFSGLAVLFALMAWRMIQRDRFPIAPAAWGALFVGAFVAMGLAAWRNWRCPACDRAWGRTVDMRRCPHCAVALEP